MQSYLFIGGSQDGISIALADVPESIRAPAGVTEKETYIRETLSVCEAAAIIYRHEDLTPEEVQPIDRVLQGIEQARRLTWHFGTICGVFWDKSHPNRPTLNAPSFGAALASLYCVQKCVEPTGKLSGA
jgi:hypothetical protein